MVVTAAAAAAKSLQSCPTLWDPIDSSPPGSSVPGTLQARTLEWVAISFSNTWKWKVKVKSLSRVRLLVTPWSAAHQAPPSMGFSRQEYWSGVPLPLAPANFHHLQLLPNIWPSPPQNLYFETEILINSHSLDYVNWKIHQPITTPNYLKSLYRKKKCERTENQSTD